MHDAEDYERGRTAAHLEALHESLKRVEATLVKLEDEIRHELNWMRDEVTGIKIWKAKVMGMATAVAIVASVLMDWIKAHIRLGQ